LTTYLSDSPEHAEVKYGFNLNSAYRISLNEDRLNDIHLTDKDSFVLNFKPREVITLELA